MKTMKTSIVKNIPALAIPFAMLAAPSAASAMSTVTFQGEVTDQTCNVVVNGNTSGVVMLPTVSSASLKDAGATAGLTPFTVQVDGCKAPKDAAQKISTKFLGHNVTTKGNLGNTGTATNVAIQLTDKASGGKAVVLNGLTAVAGLELPTGQTSASYQFGVQYVSENGGAGAGSVQAVAEYTLSYL